MNKTRWGVVAVMTLALCGCATMGRDVPLNADQTAQAFFDRLQRSDYQGAYSFLGKGLSQRIAYDQFEEFMSTLRSEWGRIVTEETETMPFHKRPGESEFIPLHAAPQQVKRYIFEVKYDNADMNFDVTIAPEGDTPKIVWFSIWGSSIYLTKHIQEQMEKLFSNPDESGT